MNDLYFPFRQVQGISLMDNKGGGRGLRTITLLRAVYGTLY